jgi:hypothetical protein
MLKMEAECQQSLVKYLLQFPVRDIRLTPKASAPLERVEYSGVETRVRFCIYFFFLAISALEEHGRGYKSVRVYTRAWKQGQHYIYYV